MQEAAEVLYKKLERAAACAIKMKEENRKAYRSEHPCPVLHAFPEIRNEGFGASDAELVAMALSSGSRSDSALLWSGDGGGFSGGGASGSWDSGSSSSSDYNSSDSSSSYSSD